MTLLDLQDLELPEASRDPLMASFSDSDSDSNSHSSLSLILCG
jgi:hypothetical protein